jgi:hypothetical protein
VTIQVLIATAVKAGIVLAADAGRLKLTAPAGALTPELRQGLTLQKAEVLAVLSRLAGMRANVGKVPIPCAVLHATGGPGRCFSCGESLYCPDAYGRCARCQIGVELYYSSASTEEVT